MTRSQLAVNLRPTFTWMIVLSALGVGHADKVQIQHMIKLLLPGVDLAGADAADALAVAICHAWAAGASDRIAKALEAAQ